MTPAPKPSKVKKKKRRTIPKLKKDARHWFQRWIRLSKIQEGVNCCYGCGKWLTDIKTCDACHFLKAELYPQAIFDRHNVYIGCKGCNIRDPLLEYRKWLVVKKGENHVTNLEDKYKVNRGTYKWNREFLENIINEFKQKCKELES